MKLATFVDAATGDDRLGVVSADGNQILDVVSVAPQSPWAASMQALIEAGPTALEELATVVGDDTDGPGWQPLASVRLRAPLPLPAQIRDFANYEGHVLGALSASMKLRSERADDPAAELARLEASGTYRIPDIWYELPLYYKANRFAVAGPDDVVVWPPFSSVIDYEIELACVIGQPGRDIAEADAESHIFGYTIFNDFSARDVQARWEGQFRMGPAKGKDFDGSNIFGPWIVTPDEVGPVDDLTMIVRINGTERARGRVGDAQHSFARCISHVSQAETLHSGEILALGTMPNGCGFETLNFIASGDEVELEIERIGTLRNRVVMNVDDSNATNSAVSA